MAQSDDIARLTEILVRSHQGSSGKAARLRQASGLSASEIGKACGASPDQIYSWESGVSQPTTGQALAWLSVVYEHLPPSAAR